MVDEIENQPGQLPAAANGSLLSVRIKKRLGRKDALTDDSRAGLPTNRTFELNVEFKAPPGVTVLFGPSGSGKSTTLRSIAGIVKPDSGRISIDDTILFDSQAKIDVPIHLRRTGFVFQNLALFPHLSTLENVEFGIRELPREERRRRALALMEPLKVAHTAERRPGQISGGEAQRVALARALAASPRLLLLDEPLSAVDEATKFEIIGDLRTINKGLRLPIMFVTHNREEAVSLGERLIVIEDGRVHAEGEPLEIFGPPVSTSVARLTGVENIFEGRILSVHQAAGSVTIAVNDEVGSSQIEAPLGRYKESDTITLAIRSGDILLATEKPVNTSARNLLHGKITNIEKRSDRVMVSVLSGVSWKVSVTRQSVEELGLEVDKPVWLAFKTYSCHILDK